MPPFSSWLARRMWAFDGDDGMALVVCAGEVRGGELSPAAQRRAGGLGPADDVLLVAQDVAVPVLDEDLDAPGHQVAPAPHPRLVGLVADPDVVVEEVGLLRLDVAGAVFEAEQVPRRLLGRAGGGGPAETELHPVVVDHAQPEPGQVAHGVKGHERVARAGLDAQVAADVVRVEVLVGQRRAGRPAPRASGRTGRTGRRRGTGRSRW